MNPHPFWINIPGVNTPDISQCRVGKMVAYNKAALTGRSRIVDSGGSVSDRLFSKP